PRPRFVERLRLHQFAAGTGAVPAAVPGAPEFAYPIAELGQAQRLRDAVDEMDPDGASIKEAGTRNTARVIGRGARKPGATFWLKGGKRPEQTVFVPEVITKS
ncbi:MAG: hypothetical protein QOE04_3475, partial [Mycobacterium sp.]|nr:hypothetical protein [Mycobacterium sp.]